MATAGGEFGYEDPPLTISLTTMMMMKNKRLTELGLCIQVRHPLPTNLAPPTTRVNKWKCILCCTSSPACLTLLMKKPLC